MQRISIRITEKTKYDASQFCPWTWQPLVQLREGRKALTERVTFKDVDTLVELANAVGLEAEALTEAYTFEREEHRRLASDPRPDPWWAAGGFSGGCDKPRRRSHTIRVEVSS